MLLAILLLIVVAAWLTATPVPATLADHTSDDRFDERVRVDQW